MLAVVFVVLGLGSWVWNAYGDSLSDLLRSNKDEVEQSQELTPEEFAAVLGFPIPDDAVVTKLERESETNSASVAVFEIPATGVANALAAARFTGELEIADLPGTTVSVADIDPTAVDQTLIGEDKLLPGDGSTIGRSFGIRLTDGQARFIVASSRYTSTFTD